MFLEHLALYGKRVKELKEKIRLEAKNGEDMKLLQSTAGVGPVAAYAYTAYAGDGIRFSKGAQVSNYIGFAPRPDYSGTIQRQGRITKRGNGYLRGLLIQAAWAMVLSRSGGALKERFICLTKEQGKSRKKTIVSISRRLTELMYSVLRSKTKYEARPWNGPKNDPRGLAEQAVSA